MDYSQLYLTLGRSLGYGSVQEFTDAINKNGLQGALSQGGPGGSQNFQAGGDEGLGPGWAHLGNNLVQKLMDQGLDRETATSKAKEIYKANQDHADYWSGYDSNGQSRGNYGTNGAAFDANKTADELLQMAHDKGIYNPYTVKQDVAKAAADKAKAGEDQGAKDSIMGQLQSFSDRMLGQMDPNDPIVRGLTQQGTSAAGRLDALRGIRGGASGLNTQMAVGNSLTPYQQQRTTLGLQGLSAMSGRDLGEMQNSIALLNAQNQAQNFKNTAAQQNYSAQQGQGAGLGGLIGGIAGTGIGALLAPFTGGASLALGGVGAGIGSGIGGMGAGPAPTMGGYQTKPMYGGYSSSGGSNNNGSGF